MPTIKKLLVLKSQKSFFRDNVKDNILQHILYKISYPFSLIFSYLGLTPNNITCLSFFLCVFSGFFIIKNDHELFLICWYLSHFLDYCDGTLARITNNTTKILLRVDHLSDLIKLQITLISFSIYYSNIGVWICFSVFNIIFWISEVLSVQYKLESKVSNKTTNNSKFKSKVLKNIYNIFFTFDGHSLLLIGLTVINSKVFIIILIYYSFLLLKRTYTPLTYLSRNLRK